jgi:hypothetical protein
MTSMSHDPAVALIGGQLTEMAAAAIAAGAAAAPAVTALVPAGAEEVSAQAATAFAAEAAKALALHAAAHQEIARTGAALVDITRMYAQTDATAAGQLAANAAHTSAVEFGSVAASGPWANPVSTGAGLLRAEAVPGAAGTPARTAAMTNLLEGAVAAPTPAAGTAGAATTMPTAMSAASTLLSAGSAPLSTLSSLGSSLGSVGQGGAAAGGATGPALASSLTGTDDDRNPKDSDGPDRGQHLL